MLGQMNDDDTTQEIAEYVGEPTDADLETLLRDVATRLMAAERMAGDCEALFCADAEALESMADQCLAFAEIVGGSPLGR